ncbi:MAG TPA: hypothetical protein GX736_01020 [Mogibacterium sp.]|nr:hypothetical protein [Mogibacterium sp.]
MKRIYTILLCLLILISLPVVIWYLEPGKECRMAIIDKTVPDETYRGHNGIVFLLNHLKYKKQSKDLYDLREDYFGFSPNEKEKSYKLKPLPANYDDYDIIYLADSYGVYEGDLPWKVKENEGSVPRKIYGGLEKEEWLNIHNRLAKENRSLFIAEHNAFATPTKKEVRESITNYLGVNWSGWKGRYFDELDFNKNKKIPQWIKNKFGESWDYKGYGFILVNDIDSRVLVLEKSEHVSDKNISLSFTREGEDFFGLKKSSHYNHWFDIITPKQGSTVLANYNLNLTERGKELLLENGITTEFAAVVKTEQGSSSSYYFAGDYNSIDKVPALYKFKGLQKLYSFVEMNSDSAFYWSAYFPMMEKILDNYYNPSEKDMGLEEKEKNPYDARIKGNSFEILIDGKWEPIAIKGVNMGMGKPGAFPGEAAITEDEYYRWFEQIGEMNANVIRVYTLHPPGFYNSLLRYNETHDKKIYVMHGVWINEEELEASQDVFDKKTLADFQQEMKTITDVIHGNKVVDARPGHASGAYKADVSQYVIAWILGIEWDPYMVENTNHIHFSIGEYKGTFFETRGANPFEYWLAQQMDTIVKYEKKHYDYLRPVSFTNWPTTDILEHPANFQDNEDLVGVDPNVIYTKGEMDSVGQFASYHIYPYYPDFLNFEKKYLDYVDHRGQKNNYAGYLNHLKSVHRLPILVAEFGIPASRGLTHENPFGWNQGFKSEKEQGEIVSRLYEDILEEDMLGGLIFTWQDEWFKRTWNTMDYDNPDRRPFWSNAQTNEQQYGLLSFDRHKIKVDGDIKDWETEPLYKKNGKAMKGLYVDHDERYLYIRLDYSGTDKAYPLILLDVVPDQGNSFIKEKKKLKFSNGVDFIIKLNKKNPKILIDQYYDFYTYMYAYHLKLIEKPKKDPHKNSGVFSQIHYVISREYRSENGKILMPFSSYEAGKLRKGNADPDSKNYDSLADFYINDDGGLELRIPWLLIQSRDPSKKEFIGNIYKDGIEASKLIDEIYIGVLYVDDNGTVLDSFPGIENNVLNPLKAYTWDEWDIPKSKERLKQSYYIIQDLFAD